MKGRPALTLVLIFVFGLMLGIGIKAIFFSDPIVDPESTSKELTKSRQRLFDEADVSAEDIELVQGKQGSMTWKLLAKTAKYNQEKGLIGVDYPQLTAYFGDDRQEVYVRADRGEVDQANDNLTLSDGVSGRFGDLALDAQQLDYVGAIDKVYLKGGVTVRRPDMTITATALEIDLITRQLVAAGGVEALLAPEGLERSPL
ncbi:MULTISPECIES: LPS export ABC transporter periplasmic protein LptC [unclassified Pseudodesulfovibrio]|uniref:LPS export ABC transporter periplasmic protein LptC n=1 Tax=unclassified Pseudodesulfovibrio TaxID=2661612 RepID=UPI000FEB6ACA|nr:MULTISPECIES: LPS export ABC transporter periplasmic protein LptC [unclassified Pseudodesulfovibrio]MCJ2163920.1 LPS export ABC transporter periplasmic protein LptC [Pseudodesulfovibrio sp. S3-i]RWU05835.1 LPS export ABC transporter periplasmic protein LptC [Pseudodesulfovibrio sp. S3]